MGFGAGIELVAKDVGGGESGEHVQPRGAKTVVVKPQERRGHLRQLVRVVNRLRLAEAEPIWRHRRVAVTVSRDKAAMKMGHQPHLIAERRLACVDRKPSGYVAGRLCVKLTVNGVPLRATRAIPNEPAWPASPEPSSYAQSGVGGR